MASEGALSADVITTRGSGSQTSVSSGLILFCCARAGMASSVTTPADIIDLIFMLLFYYTWFNGLNPEYKYNDIYRQPGHLIIFSEGSTILIQFPRHPNYSSEKVP